MSNYRNVSRDGQERAHARTPAQKDLTPVTARPDRLVFILLLNQRLIFWNKPSFEWRLVLFWMTISSGLRVITRYSPPLVRIVWEKTTTNQQNNNTTQSETNHCALHQKNKKHHRTRWCQLTIYTSNTPRSVVKEIKEKYAGVICIIHTDFSITRHFWIVKINCG